MKRSSKLVLVLTLSVMTVFAMVVIGQARPAPNPEAVAEVLAGVRDEANVAWWGFDPEDSTVYMQAAINSGASRVIIPDMGEDWVIRPIFLRSNLELIFEEGAVVAAKRGEYHGRLDSVFTAEDAENLVMRGYGATIRMHKEDYDNRDLYEKAEWRMGVNLRGTKNVEISGLTIKDTGGDGIYLGRGSRLKTNEDVIIRDVVLDNNYRQGISVISARNLLIEDSLFRYTSGTAPMAGIDFEPNRPDEVLENIVIRNSVFEGNDGYGILIYLKNLTEQSELSFLFEDILIRGGGYGVYIDTASAQGRQPSGEVVLRNCIIEHTLRDGIRIINVDKDAVSLVFEECVIHQAGTHQDSLPISILAGRNNNSNTVGGIRFQNVVVTDDRERPALSADANPVVAGGFFEIDGHMEVVNPHGAEALWRGPTHDVTLDVVDVESAMVPYNRVISLPDYQRPKLEARIEPALVVTPICGYVGDNMLANPGFEEVHPSIANRPAGWGGSAQHWEHVERTQAAARTGDWGIKIHGTAFIYQSRPVTPGVAYELAAWVRHDEGYRAGLKIELRGEGGVYLRDNLNSNTIYTSVDSEWTRITAQLVAPEGARTAGLLVRSYDGEVYFDDISFREVECLPVTPEN